MEYEWIEFDPQELPPFGRMLVCNRVQSWAVDMVHAGKKDDWRGNVFAFTDDNRIACGLSHYIPIAMPAPSPAPNTETPHDNAR